MTSQPTQSEATATYPMPKDGYVCFHCGDRFTTIGAASDHFGGSQGATAACKIKFGDELGLVMELRKAEASRDEWMEQALQGRSEVERLESRVESLTSAMQSYKPFRECRSINDVFFVFDSMEGRAIAAEAKLRDFGPYDDTQPVLAALSMLESDLDATDRQRQIARMAIGVLTAPSPSEAASGAWIYLHEHDASLIRKDGFMCEQHPGTEFPHDDCAGPGESWRIEGKDRIQSLLNSTAWQAVTEALREIADKKKHGGTSWIDFVVKLRTIAREALALAASVEGGE